MSNRRIAAISGISRNTVNTYIKLFTASDYPFTSLLELENAALAELFSSYTMIDTDRHNELIYKLDLTVVSTLRLCSEIL
ncbi:hypothetical protein [Sphingobacterium mizutaii]|uniref:hypothetical protein n=1 Tax=Sphingobacterium mizutaii TaxID=1010 RepID=UPI003D99D9F4